MFRQNEQQSREQTAQAGRLDSAVQIANESVYRLEVMLHESRRESEEESQLLSGSVSAVYALEGESMRAQRVIIVQGEEMSQASRNNADMKASWDQLSDANASLRARLISLDVHRSLGQQDTPMRSPEDEHAKSALAACLARESVWKRELHTK